MVKALLVYPEFRSASFWNYKATRRLFGARYPAAPLGLCTVAALLPKDWDVKLVDRNVEEWDDSVLDWADIVLTGGMLPQQRDCLDLIRKARARGKTIVVGGADATSSPHLYAGASHLVLGEAEVTLPMFLADLATGSAKAVYTAPRLADVQSSPTPRFDILRFGEQRRRQHATSPVGSWAVGRLLDRCAVGFLNDPRDFPLVRVILSASLIIPAAVYLYLPGRFDWRLAVAYWLVWALVFLDRVTLMLHCTSHRTLFKPPVRWMNHYVPWILGPFYGQTPTTYFAHHIAMHHVEDNLVEDLSSTMRYRRDRFLDWLRYTGRFLAFNVVLLPVYLYRHGRRGLAGRAVMGELTFWTVAAGLAHLNWHATVVVFLLPVLAIRALMMAGNWAQHAFIDPADPANDYRNSITCINCRYNRRCFNDGYHIVHHLRPTQHWTELPADFETRREVYGKNDAVVFDGIDFFTVWLYLMLHRWNALARAFVRLPGAPPRSDDEVVTFLKERLQPIGRTHAPPRRARRWTAAALVAAVVLASATAWAESAVEIMQKQRAMHRTKDEEETLLMRLVSKTGAVKERRLGRYTLTGPDTLSKILIRFLAPRSLENTGLLTWEAPNGDDDQWLYLPATKKVKRVAASGKSQRFMGTDFAYEDMQPESVRLHRYRLLGSESIDGQDCHVIEAVPATERQAADSGYSKRRLWVRKDNYFTVKREYYDRKGKLEKVGTERKLVQVSGTVWRATELEMHDLEAGTRTILVVEQRAVDKGLKESLLTETGLTQGGP